MMQWCSAMVVKSFQLPVVMKRVTIRVTGVQSPVSEVPKVWFLKRNAVLWMYSNHHTNVPLCSQRFSLEPQNGLKSWRGSSTPLFSSVPLIKWCVCIVMRLRTGVVCFWMCCEAVRAVMKPIFGSRIGVAGSVLDNTVGCHHIQFFI